MTRDDRRVGSIWMLGGSFPADHVANDGIVNHLRRAGVPATTNALLNLTSAGSRDVYLRCLLTHGARAVLLTAQRTLRRKSEGTRFQHWAVAVAARRGHNKAAIAVANKLAQIVWAVWRSEQDFAAGPQVAVAV